MKLEFFLFACIAMTLVLYTSCHAQKNSYIPDTPYYYGSFSGYQIPFVPSEPLSYEAALQRKSYYIAYYDKKGKIISFSKYLNKQMFSTDKYFYREAGTLKKREMIKASGEVTIQYFDEAGKLIPTESNTKK